MNVLKHTQPDPPTAAGESLSSSTHAWNRSAILSDSTSVVCRVFGAHGRSLPSHSFTYGDSRSMDTVPFHAAPTTPYFGSM
ncbi:hypothetical protein ACFWWT_46890 [Streptomyces sp. NPDC058676]|uniref:hypothetical protein n=1 Tax=unclassified Streptomyces TaxID=2593676 RepID=UPI0036643040